MVNKEIEDKYKIWMNDNIFIWKEFKFALKL